MAFTLGNDASWWRRVELPTWLLAGAIYGGWLALTLAHHRVPAWITPLAGAWLVAWHGSLQHEAIHGHPSRRPRLNAALAGLPLGLWLPYGLYRKLHLAHHRSVELTCPLEDPESFYLTPEAWARSGPFRRAFHRAHATLLGRLVLGPPRAVLTLYTDELRRLRRGDRSHLGIWGAHALGVGAVLLWVVGVCGIPIWLYLLGFVYPGLALTLLRSYAEHRAAPARAHRTAVIEAGPVLSLLYLNNNLHAVHHARPRLPWYEIPRWYRAHRDRVLAKNGSYLVPGYLSLLARRALRAPPPVYPLSGDPDGRRQAA